MIFEKFDNLLLSGERIAERVQVCSVFQDSRNFGKLRRFGKLYLGDNFGDLGLESIRRMVVSKEREKVANGPSQRQRIKIPG
jgi:hypothetical protein